MRAAFFSVTPYSNRTRMRWVEHIARMVEMRNSYRISAEKLKGRELFWSILVKLTLEKSGWLDLSASA
jgi:hypothetical protein